MRLLYGSVVAVLISMASTQIVFAQAAATSAFMRMKNGVNYNPVSLAATDANQATYPVFNGFTNNWVQWQFVDGNNIVNTFLGPASTGAGNSSGVTGTYVQMPMPGMPQKSTTEAANWKTSASVTTGVSPTYNTQLQPGIGINDLHQNTYTLQITSSDSTVDYSNTAGVSAASAAATGLYQEPFPGPQFNAAAAPVQYAAVTLDPVATPVGTVKAVSGSLMLAGQATFAGTGGDSEGGAGCEVDINVHCDGVLVANASILNNFATYSWTSGGVQYHGFQDFTLTNSPSFTINFDGTATISDQSAPVTVVDVDFVTQLGIGESNLGNDVQWGKSDPRRGNAAGNWMGQGGAHLSFELMINLVSP